MSDRTERVYLSPPDMGEEERRLLLEAFDSGWIAPLGPHVDAFEREFAEVVGARHAVALSSGTAGLHLALRLVGVGPGDRVVVPTLTFVATANAVRYLGAEPVFVDCDPETWTLDPRGVEEVLERGKVAAVVTVDLFGQCADHDPIVAACRRRGVPVVEDAAEGLGATYRGRSAGTLADVGVFSFNGNKILTTSGGGMLVTERAEWAAKATHWATQAREPARHYEHRELGYNYRLSNLLAAVGRGQLRSLEAKVAKRRAVFGRYVEELGDLPGVEFMPEASYGRCTRWLTCLTVDEDALGVSRDALLEHVTADQIEVRPVWKPMHLQPLYREAEVRGGEVSEALFARGLCLPSGSNLTPEVQGRVIRKLREAAGR